MKKQGGSFFVTCDWGLIGILILIVYLHTSAGRCPVQEQLDDLPD